MEILIYLSIAPVLAIIIFFYILDKYEPEPKNLVVKTFGFGALSIFPVVIVECTYNHFFPIPYKTDDLVLLFISIFTSIGLVEELGKLMVVILGIYRSPEFDEPYDGIIYTVSASLGFAALENICYVMIGGIGVGILRAIFSVPAHALFGAIMGYFLGLSKFTKKILRIILVFSGLFISAIAHTLFDFFILSQKTLLMLLTFPFMLFMIITVFLMIRSAEKCSFYRFNPQKEETPVGSDQKCKKCNYSIPNDSKFCKNCGSPITIDKIYCSSCNFGENSYGHKNCIKCGKPLDYI